VKGKRQNQLYPASAASLRIADILIMGINSHMNITSEERTHQAESRGRITIGTSCRNQRPMASGNYPGRNLASCKRVCRS
jgi:hypothetical protein